ncbi:MAG: AAA family ATPase [Oscillospiraceae bacterium]|jgi:AAA15 family ATPase/GTPase|nr:AAA family ATPase [Subdoligranulum variabile]UYJ33689.1 MAG: AAA family ATPase [Oscillospiraceae bacterium]
MKIKQLVLQNFMIFDSIDVEWSSGINVIIGENSTGKTTLLKALYSLVKPYGRKDFSKSTQPQQEEMIVRKMVGVFRPDGGKIGRLASRRQGSSKNLTAQVSMLEGDCISVSFGSRSSNHADISIHSSGKVKPIDPVYLPPKEMISATEHFQSLYEEYHIDFEEMYYDLTKLLDKPLKKGANTSEQNEVLSKFEDSIKGNIVQRDKKFYLNVEGKGSFEMGLVSEGYKKLATIVYLIQSGSLSKGSVLFWDEPETNMNPKMVEPIAQALGALSRAGVQIFVTTHDYFTMQSLNLIAKYPHGKPVDVQFVSLYHDSDGKIMMEKAKDINDLTHNSIMEEFDALYNREQDLIYDIN